MKHACTHCTCHERVDTTDEDKQYAEFLTQLRTTFERRTVGAKVLFRTNTPYLFQTFLSQLPEERRQHYTCHACSSFVRRFGGVVVMNEDGSFLPAIWDNETAPEFFRYSVLAAEARVRNSTVSGVFYSHERTIGHPRTGEWYHMSVELPGSLVFQSIQGESQAAAERAHDLKTLKRAIGEFSKHTVQQAKTLLESDALYRSEKVLGAAEWLLALHERLEGVKDGRKRESILWYAVATAPAGFAHVRSTMIGTLLEDIQSGMQFETVARRFKDKMHPLQYQRPTAAPTAGQVAAAEKLVEQMGIASALERRFAQLDDLQKLWEPKCANQSEPKGVFGHLLNANQERAIEGPSRNITWTKFAREVLPSAERIEYQTPYVGPFVAFVTAKNPDSVPILQWDSPERRNTVSWYLHIGGSTPESFSLQTSAWVEVEAVVLGPHMWNPERTHSNQPESASLILRGCHETSRAGGGGLFVECLRGELHAVRHVIEAHVKTQVLPGREDSACGIAIMKGSRQHETVRVTSGGVRMTYVIDRWD